MALAQLFNDVLEGRGECSHLLRTQVDFLEKEQQGTGGEGWTLSLTVTHVGVMVPFNPL